MDCFGHAIQVKDTINPNTSKSNQSVIATYGTPKGVDTGTNATALEASARVMARMNFMMYYLSCDVVMMMMEIGDG